jgi:hypothetical protein
MGLLSDAIDGETGKEMKMRHDDDDDDAFDERGVLRDKHSVRFSALFMDSSQRYADDILRREFGDGGDNVIRDAAGRPAGHRHGFLIGPSSDASKAAATAYDERSRKLADAWRHPTPVKSHRDETNDESQSRQHSQGDAEAQAADARSAYIAGLRDAWRRG